MASAETATVCPASRRNSRRDVPDDVWDRSNVLIADTSQRGLGWEIGWELHGTIASPAILPTAPCGKHQAGRPKASLGLRDTVSRVHTRVAQHGIRAEGSIADRTADCEQGRPGTGNESTVGLPSRPRFPGLPTRGLANNPCRLHGIGRRAIPR